VTWTQPGAQVRKSATVSEFTILDCVPTAILVMERHGRLRFANSAWRELTGLTLDEVGSSAWLASVDPFPREKLRAWLGQDPDRPFECALRTMAGRKWSSWTWRHAPDGSDNLVVSVTVAGSAAGEQRPDPGAECFQARPQHDGQPPSRQVSGPTVSVVIPTHNEARNIPWVLRRMPKYVDEVVLVDGRSTDGTVDVARAMRPDIVVVSSPKRGKGFAIREGLAASTGDIIVMMDADGSMDPREIECFVAPLRFDYDLVKGSRHLTGGGSEDLTPLRRSGNRVLTRVTNVLYRSHFSDLCYGFMAMRRECLDVLELHSAGFEIETELAVHAVRAGLRVAEVPSRELTRLSGNSNLNTFRDGWRVLNTLAHEWAGWDSPTAGRRPEGLRAVCYGSYGTAAGHVPRVPVEPHEVLAGWMGA
jgi:hypothetical protein